MPLANDIIVYPAHGAGSACGKIYEQRNIGYIGAPESNQPMRCVPTWRKMSSVKEWLNTPPAYFPLNVLMNIKDTTASVMWSNVEHRHWAPMLLKLLPTKQVHWSLIQESRRFCKRIYSQLDQYWYRRTICTLGGHHDSWCKTGNITGNRTGTRRRSGNLFGPCGIRLFIGYLKGGFDAWKQPAKKPTMYNVYLLPNLQMLLHCSSAGKYSRRKKEKWIRQWTYCGEQKMHHWIISMKACWK